jgi:2-keto-4-pentenoate hydratase/2-oxohepta-3-ene-1,7-dioic acid hydratase in catechol pathway
MSSMHIVRYALQNRIHVGIVEDDAHIARVEGGPFDGLRRSGVHDRRDAVRILCPLPLPRVFGLGYNYRAHSQEVGKKVPQLPILFMKPSTSVIGPDESIVYPAWGENIHFEGELVVVIGKQARNVPESAALDYVLGYTCGNDVSDRVLQRRESEFGCLFAGKGYDTFAPMGPVIATGLDPSQLRILTRVNGVLRQDGNSADLLFSVPYLIAYLSRHMTLLPGDMIMTGTPAGVGPIQVGDSIEVEIPGIGILRNGVVAASRAGEPARHP